jgi:DNA-binding transcriptional regulator YhcF (GntR family)
MAGPDKTVNLNLVSSPPRSAQLAEQIRREVASLPVGAQLRSIREMARDLDVSQTVVRLAYDRLKKQGLIERRHGSGTFACRPSGAGQVVILAHSRTLDEPKDVFRRHLLNQLARLVEADGGTPEIRLPDRADGVLSDRRILDDVLRDAAEGLRGQVVSLLGGGKDLPRGWMKELRKREWPVVGLGPEYECYVACNYSQFFRLAAERLAAEGRRRAALVQTRGASVSAGGTMFAQMFRRSVRACGIQTRPEWMASVDMNDPGWSWEELRRVLAAASSSFDCIVFSDDQVFRSAIPAIMASGRRVPRDVLIVSHGNRDLLVPAPFPSLRLGLDVQVYAREMLAVCLARPGLKGAAAKRRVDFGWLEEPQGSES